MLIAWLACVGTLAAVAGLTYAIQQKSNGRETGRREAPSVQLAIKTGEEPELRAPRRLPEL